MGRQVIQSASLFFSPTGTTRKIVKNIAQGLALRPRDVDLTLPAGRERGVALERDELVVLAFPVHGGRLPGVVRDYLLKLPGGRRPAAAVVVYGNRAYGDALLELYDLCQSKGFEVVGAAAFVGEHAFSQVMGRGRPDPADEERARRFGLAVRQTLLGDGRITERHLLGKAGQRRPYRQYFAKPDLVPHTGRLCAKCLACVRNCPVGAFVNGDPKSINADKCILCAACVKLCPERAKSFQDDDFTDDLAAMAASNLDRKEPETFLP